MTTEFSSIITCDECGDSQDFTLTGEYRGRGELVDLAERSGWDCDGQDLCANCVSVAEWQELSDEIDEET